MLRKAIAAAPSDAMNRGCLADLCWRRAQREEAIAEVQRAVILDPDYNWGWQALRDWSALERGENLAAEAARELVRRRSGESRCWIRLAESLQGHENVAEQLGAVDRALALNPRNGDAWDLRATFLAEQGRYAEALNACQPEAFGAAVPSYLKGRAAWVESQRGRLKQAIKQMRGVVKEAPDYYWGWSRLADWHLQAEEPALALEAAEQMARLQPHNVSVLGYLGDARLALDRRNEAREAFVRAWDLDPLYGFAAQKLFELQLQDKQFDEADATVQKLQRHMDDAEVVAAETRLAAARGRKEQALAAMEDLCRRKGDIAYAIHTANNALTDAGWSKEAHALFWKLLPDPETNAEAGGVWAKQLSYLPAWRWWKAAFQLHARTPAQKEALGWLLNSIGEEKRRWLLGFVLWRFGAELRADDRAWGNVTYAASNVGQFRRTIWWMHDWKSRAGVQPWMLLNLANALRQRGRDTEAHEVGLAATKLPADHTTDAHFLMLAVDEALADNFAEAERYRDEAADQKPVDETKFVASALNALLEMHALAPEQRCAALPEIRRRLRADLAASGPLDRAGRLLYRRTLLRLVEEAGDQRGWLAAYVRTLPRPTVSPEAARMIPIVLILLLVFRGAWLPAAAELWKYLRSFFLP